MKTYEPAYKNDPAIKAQAVAEMQEHKRLDQLARGHYWEQRKNSGCAIGCMAGMETDGSAHAFVAKKLGLTEGLLHIVDNLFENIPDGEHLDWPLQFLEAIPVGANLDAVYPKYMLALATDETYGLRGLIEKTQGTPEELAQFDAFAALYRVWVETGERPPHSSWEVSERAARAAWAARDARAARAAWAARAARAARAAWAARAAYIRFERDTLLKLLKEAAND